MRKFQCEAVVDNWEDVMEFVEAELEALECTMKQTMDDVKYEYRDGKNILTLEKNINI